LFTCYAAVERLVVWHRNNRWPPSRSVGSQAWPGPGWAVFTPQRQSPGWGHIEAVTAAASATARR